MVSTSRCLRTGRSSTSTPGSCHRSAVNPVAAGAGVSGGLYSDVHIGLADPNGDGKVHLDEILAKLSTPLEIFEADGSLYYSLNAYATIGYGPISIPLEKSLSSGKLLDFNPDDAPGAQAVMYNFASANRIGITGDPLMLHIGDYSAYRAPRAEFSDGRDTILITRIEGDALEEVLQIEYDVKKYVLRPGIHDRSLRARDQAASRPRLANWIRTSTPSTPRAGTTTTASSLIPEVYTRALVFRRQRQRHPHRWQAR